MPRRQPGEGGIGSEVVGGRLPASGIAGEDLDGVAADLLCHMCSLDGVRVGGHVAAKTH